MNISICSHILTRSICLSTHLRLHKTCLSKFQFIKNCFILFILFLCSCSVFAQTYQLDNLIHKTTQTVCSGTFYDDGGEIGDYTQNQNRIITFRLDTTNCPTSPGCILTFTFQDFSISPKDTLFIYDGCDTTASLLHVGPLKLPFANNSNSLKNWSVRPSANNTLKCLTFRFKSGNNTTSSGWAASIECKPLCQDFAVKLDSTFYKIVNGIKVPAQIKYNNKELIEYTLSDGSVVKDTLFFNSIDICKGDTISLSAKTDYPSDSTTKFYWDFGNSIVDSTSGNTVLFHYPIEGGYNLSLKVINLQGCTSFSDLFRVRIAWDQLKKPIVLQDLCMGETLSLGIDVMVNNNIQKGAKYIYDKPSLIPDGQNCNPPCYKTSINFNEFPQDKTIQSATDICALCITAEHSYSGDLGISLICPNGQRAQLMTYRGQDVIINGIYYPAENGPAELGIPPSTRQIPGQGSPDYCTQSLNKPGIGWRYCWSEEYLDNSIGPMGIHTKKIRIDSTDYNQKSKFFTPDSTFANLIGCPLNGEWSIEVCDYWEIENGYIFNWSLEFCGASSRIWEYEVALDSLICKGPFTHRVTRDSTSIIPTASGEYTYEIGVVDAFGCYWDTTTTLNVLPSISLNLPKDTLICSYDTITLDVTQSGNVNYLWEDNSTNPVRKISKAGKYWVTAFREECPDNKITDTIYIDHYPSFGIDLGNDTPLCPTSSTIVNAKPKQTGNYTYQWNTGSTDSSIMVNNQGTYSVIVSRLECPNDKAGDSIQITYPEILQPINLGNDTMLCPSTSVTLYAKPQQSGNFIYQWNTGSTDSAITVNTQGAYKVVVSRFECPDEKVEDSIRISYYSPFSVSLGNDTLVCPTDSILLDARQTNGNFTYLWQDNSTFPDFKANTEGKYWVHVNRNECPWDTKKDSIHISFFPEIQIDLGQDTTLCPSASIVLSAKPKQAGNYVYQWNDGSTDSVLNVTSAGIYKVQVRRVECLDQISEDSITINYFDPLSPIDLGHDTTICSYTLLPLHAKPNQSGNFIYQWNTGITDSIQLATQGFYKVMVSRVECPSQSISDSIQIFHFSSITINLGNNTTICSADTILLNATQINGNFTYLWQDNSTNPVLKANAEGKYWVAVTRAECPNTQYQDTIQISHFSKPLIDLGNDTTLCLSTSITLKAQPKQTGSFIYLWSPTGNTGFMQNVTSQGNYKVMVHRAECPNETVEDSIHIDFYTTPTVSLGNDTIICPSDAILLNATQTNGNFTYLWQDNSTNPTLNASLAGKYWVQVKRTECPNNTYPDTINISHFPEFTIALGKDTTLCPLNSIKLDARPKQTGIFTYLWNTGGIDSILPVSTSGLYKVKVKNITCPNQFAEDSIKISYFDPLLPINLGEDTLLCPSTSILLKPKSKQTGNIVYKWNTGNTDSIQVVNSQGVYTTTAYRLECPNITVQDSINVDYFLELAVNLGKDTSICSSNVVFLDVTQKNGNYTYLWHDNSTNPTHEINTEGKYWVQVKRVECPLDIKADTIAIIYFPPFQINLGDDTLLCPQSNIDLSAKPSQAGDFVYNWNTGESSPTINISSSGTYNVQVSRKECMEQTAHDSIHIGYHPTLTIDLGNDTTICSLSPILLDATQKNGKFTYLWQDGSYYPTMKPDQDGKYWVTVMREGCPEQYQGTIQISYFPKIKVNLGNDTILCKADSILLNATQNQGTQASYKWHDNTTNSTYTVWNDGKYWVSVYNVCENTSDTINISVPVKPTLNLPDDTTFCIQKHRIYIEPAASNYPDYQYKWSDGITTRGRYIYQEGIYWLTLKSRCYTITDSIEVKAEDCEPALIFPNAFTPDAETNNYFSVGKNNNIERLEIWIYNRWGALVFHSRDLNFRWDGKDRGGVDLPTGSYVYQVQYRSHTGPKITQQTTGYITLIR